MLRWVSYHQQLQAVYLQLDSFREYLSFRHDICKGGVPHSAREELEMIRADFEVKFFDECL
jgi:hypothetical protein